MTTQDQEKPRRYGEARYRYQDGTLAQIRQTQTFVRDLAGGETPEHFRDHVLTWCARFDVLKQPDEVVELIETFHDDEISRATIVVQPDEPTPTSLLRAIERVLQIVKGLADQLARLKKRK